MPNYKDLQTKAKELGIPYIGISRAELETAIKSKEASSATVAPENVSLSNKPTEPGTTVPVGATKKQPKNKQPKKDQDEVNDEQFNTAIVMNEKNEVRRYSLDDHGSEFETLAQQFADKHAYTVVLKQVKPGITCPSCGHVIYPE